MLLFSMLLSGCYFHPRSPKEFPPQLKTIHFAPTKQYSTLSIELRSLFHSMDVHLTKHAKQAPYTISVTHDQFTYVRADVVDATLPSTMTFTQTATITIVDNQTKKTVLTNNFSTSQALTLNANQVYTAGSNDLVKQELNHELLSLIYYWFISTNTKTALQHANHPQSTAKP